ncbi:unnamed protein product [Lota lota]
MVLFRMALTMVRHGETQFNKDGLLQGQAIDSCLSETGVQQAEAVGLYLKDVHFTNLFVSEMLRARQTAEVILKHNSSSCALEMVCDSLLKEKSFGVAEGQPVKVYRDMAAAAGLEVLDFVAPGGESEQQVTERFKLFLESMLRRVDADHWLNRPEPVPSAPEPDPSAPEPDPSAPEPDPSAPEPVPSAPEPVPSAPEPDPSAPEPEPRAPPPAEGGADDGLGSLGVHALLVSHGAYIRAAVRHLLRALGCSAPPGCDHAHMLSLSPNTGVSRFVLTLARDQAGPDQGGPDQGGLTVRTVRAVFVHRADHLK